MLRFSAEGVSSRVRIGFPSRNGEFNGIAVDSSLSIGAVVIGGLIAVAIVWLSTRARKAPPPQDSLLS